MAGVDMVHIPYKGSTLAHPDLISGRTSLMFDTVAAINVQIKANTVRPLGVTTLQRSSVLPTVPTIAEAACPATRPAPGAACSRPPARPRRWSPS
jgi:tripartite-type tricarboxylate transporter receptor subunit TctC